MRILLLHQNFPGQFRQLVPYLLSRGHELKAICSHNRLLPQHPGLSFLRYKAPDAPPRDLHHGVHLWHDALMRSQQVGELMIQLDSENWKPHRILAHCGWGETLPVKEIWPDVPLIIWPELWIRPEHMGIGEHQGQGPKKPEIQIQYLSRNALTEASLAQASLSHGSALWGILESRPRQEDKGSMHSLVIVPARATAQK